MRSLLTLVLLTSFWIPAAAQEKAETPEPLWYGRVIKEEARVRNLADPRGDELAAPAVGSLVAVYRERAEWLEVEIPGGYAVWVFGKYLTPTDQKDVFEVVRNGVNLRPKPKNDVTNFPLPQRLHANDRVLSIRVLDEGADLDKTWVRVWSPRGVRAWMRSSEVEALKTGEDGATLWRHAEKELFKVEARVAPTPKLKRGGDATESPATTNNADPAAEANALAKAKEELARGRGLMEGDAPDLAESRVALEAVIALAPKDIVASEARLEIERLNFLVEKDRLRQELEAERERLAEEARQRQAQVREASKRKDPLGGVFVTRGALVRRVESDGSAHYFVSWGGELAAEVYSVSGRYALDDYVGFEIGVHGDLRPAAGGGMPQVDIGRLEVVARR